MYSDVHQCLEHVNIFFCKQKTAYEVRISDWSSDVCSSDLMGGVASGFSPTAFGNRFVTEARNGCAANCTGKPLHLQSMARHIVDAPDHRGIANALAHLRELIANEAAFSDVRRSEEHTSELQSLMRISYAVFCLQNKKEYN